MVVTSVALAAVKKLLGEECLHWEPETMRIELSARGVSVNDGLMSKILSAITVVTTNTWTYDHDVLFAFAVACCGVPSDPDALRHPTPEQLCWAVNELRVLTGAVIDDDEGFDPDAIDPAVATVLHDEGYILAPEELMFAQDVLEKQNQYGHDAELLKSVKEGWQTLSKVPVDQLHKLLDKLDEDAEGVQVRRLGDCKLYVAEREVRRAKQHGVLNE